MHLSGLMSHLEHLYRATQSAMNKAGLLERKIKKRERMCARLDTDIIILSIQKCQGRFPSRNTWLKLRLKIRLGLHRGLESELYNGVVSMGLLVMQYEFLRQIAIYSVISDSAATVCVVEKHPQNWWGGNFVRHGLGEETLSYFASVPLPASNDGQIFVLKFMPHMSSACCLRESQYSRSAHELLGCA